jgi:hypothetical protein
MNGGFESFSNIRDIPFIARHATHTREQVCKTLKLPADKPIVLASFGGYGLPGTRHRRARQIQEVHSGVNGEPAARPRAERNADRRAQGIVHQRQRRSDVRRRACDTRIWSGAAEVVVTKPGYGIISECIANDTAILYTSRGHFPEYDVLVAEMPKYVRQRLHQPRRSVRRQMGIADRQAAGAGENQEEAGDQRRRCGGGNPVEGARQTAQEAERTTESKSVGRAGVAQ